MSFPAFPPNNAPGGGPLVKLAHALEKAPGALFDFLIGMIIASLEDPVSIALTIAAVAVGFATGSVWIAVATFFLVYVVIRTVVGLGSAVTALAISTDRAGRTVADSVLSHGVRPPFPGSSEAHES